MKLFYKTGILATLLLTLLCTVNGAASGQPAQDAAGSMIERYRLSLEVDPDNPTLHYFLGVALIRENQIKEGLKELRIAYPAYTDSVEMHYNMGLAFSKLSDPDSAMLYFEQAEALGAMETPDIFPLVNAYYNVGLIYLEDDNLADAEETFRRVLRLDPSRAETYRLLGDIAARSNRPDDAQSYIAKYLSHYPDDQSARDYLYALHFNRGQKLFGKQDYAGARQAFMQASELAPDSPLALYYLGSLDYNDTKFNSAVTMLRQAYPNAPDELRGNIRAMLYNCALQLNQKRLWQEAITAMEPLIDDPKARSKDLLLAGNIYMQQRKYAEARKVYLKILATDPGNSKAVVSLANAESGAIDSLFDIGRRLFTKGDYKKALDRFDEILAIRPDENRASSYRKKTLEKMETGATSAFAKAKRALQQKDYPTAVASANRGLAIQPDNLEGNRIRREALSALKREIEQLLDSGFSLLAQGDLIAATAQFQKVKDLDTDNSRALDGLRQVEQKRRQQAVSIVKVGNNALDEGNIKKAKSAFAKALRLIPGMVEAEQGLSRLEALVDTVVSQELQFGRSNKNAGRLDKAEEHFKNALALRDSAEIRRELASLDKARSNKLGSLLNAARKARKAKEFGNAQTLYQRILALVPEHAAAKSELLSLQAEVQTSIDKALNTARKHVLNGDYQAALSSYREALDLDPANKEALAGLDKGKKMLQTSISSQLAAGNSAMQQGNFAAAATAYKQVLSYDPYNAEAKSALQRIEKIRLAGAKAGDENSLYLRGIELYTKGKYAEAVSAWEQVLILAPDHAKAKMNIEKARRKLKKIKEFSGG